MDPLEQEIQRRTQVILADNYRKEVKQEAEGRIGPVAEKLSEGPQQIMRQPSYRDALVGGIRKIPAGIAQAVGGLTKFREDPNQMFGTIKEVAHNSLVGPITDALLPSKYGTGTDYGKQMIKNSRQSMYNIDADYTLPPDSFKATLSNAIPQLATVGAASLTGVPMAIPAAMGLQGMGSRYADVSTKPGVSPEAASMYAGSGGATDAAIGSLSLGQLGEFGNPFTRFVKFPLENLGFGLLQTVGDIKARDAVTGETTSPEEMKRIVQHGALIDTAMGLAAGAGDAVHSGAVAEVHQRLAEMPTKKGKELAKATDFEVEESLANASAESRLERGEVPEEYPTLDEYPEIEWEDDIPVVIEKETPVSITEQEPKTEKAADKTYLDAIEEGKQQKAEGKIKQQAEEQPAPTFPEEKKKVSADDFYVATKRKARKAMAEHAKGLVKDIVAGKESALRPLKKTFGDYENINVHEVGEMEKFLTGTIDTMFGSKKVPMLGAYRKGIIYPKTLADKSQNYRKYYEHVTEMMADREVFAYQLKESMAPYFELKNPEKVDKVLRAASRLKKKADMSYETLKKMGLRDVEIDAIEGVREGTDLGLELAADSLLHSKQFETQKEADAWAASVKQWKEKIRAENYVPFDRLGDEFVWTRRKTGDPRKPYETVSHELFSSAKKADKRAIEIARNDPNIEIERGKILQQATSSAGGLPASMAKLVNELDPAAVRDYLKEHPNSSGFTRHLAERNMTRGESENLREALSSYIMELSDWASYKKHDVNIRNAIEAIDPGETIKDSDITIYKDQKLKQMAMDHYEFVKSKGEPAAALRAGLGTFFLGGMMKSVLVNMTQPLMTTWPKLARYGTGLAPEKAWIKGVRLTEEYLSSPKKFAEKHPILAAELERVDHRGHLGSEQIRDLQGIRAAASSRSKAKRALAKTANTSMIPFAGMERANRLHAFFSAYELVNPSLKKNWAQERAGLMKKASESPRARADFAEQLVKDSQFVYDKSNRPVVMRKPLGAGIGTFKTFQGNYLRLLRDEAKNPRAMARAMGSVAVLAGIHGLPFSRLLMTSLALAGWDIKPEIRKQMEEADAGEFADTVIYGGLASLTGANFASAIAPFDVSFDTSGDPIASLAQTIGGAPVGLAARVVRNAPYLQKRAHDPRRTLEPLMPEAIRNPMVAERGARQGWLSPGGEAIVSKPSEWDVGLKTFGITPLSLSHGYEKREAIRQANQRYRKNHPPFDQWIGEAAAVGDWDRVEKLKKEREQLSNQLLSQGRPPITPRKQSLKEGMYDVLAPDYQLYKRTPKANRPKVREIMELYNKVINK